jgi:hypothetical protein
LPPPFDETGASGFDGFGGFGGFVGFGLTGFCSGF